jgi:lipoprotein-anchoring transpeptidase ErfK/SrfK
MNDHKTLTERFGNSMTPTPKSFLGSKAETAEVSSRKNISVGTDSATWGPKGTRQVRREKRLNGYRWGHDVWIRQPDGSRKRYRDFSFGTRAEAVQALAALRTAGWKTRYGIHPPPKMTETED